MSTGTLDLLKVDRHTRRRALRRRGMQIAAWTGLAAIGLAKRGVLGWLGTGIGLFALGRTLLTWREERPEWRKLAAREGPSARQLLRSQHSDPVDLASATSFPASDAPPGYPGN